MTKRISIYIDGQDMFRSAWAIGPRFGLHSAKPDYEAILNEACDAAMDVLRADEVEIRRSVIYTVAKHSARNFTRALERAGFELFIHVLREPGVCGKCGARNDKFSWRTQIAVDVIRDTLVKGEVDGVVLATGSPALAVVGEFLQGNGVGVVSLGFPGRTSPKLVNVRYLTDRCLYGERFKEEP